MAPDDRAIDGYCPMGCGRTLFLGDGGYPTCSFIRCPRPDAVAGLLEDRETEHIVVFGEDAFTVRHPLRERLDDALMNCDLHEYIAGLAGPPVRPGRYRSRVHDGRWTWEPLEPIAPEAVPADLDAPRPEPRRWQYPMGLGGLGGETKP